MIALALLALAHPARAALPPVPRDLFNRTAAAIGIPLVWETDTDQDGVPSPTEVVRLGRGGLAPITAQEVADAVDAVRESLRRDAVHRELAQGRPALARTDLTGLPEAEREMARHLLAAAGHVDRLYALQQGAADLVVPEDLDPESRALLTRNQGPWCVAPETEDDPFCNALPYLPEQRWGTWPADRPHTPALCDAVRARPDVSALTGPFVAVRGNGESLQAVTYHDAWGAEMDAVAVELEAAAKALDGTKEKALRKYLLAAAKGFRSNTWDDADEAWAAMDSRNSRWYLRVAPDEVYWDLCQEKAGFGMTVGLIDDRFLTWADRLGPLRGDMEKALARVIGPAYAPRKVSFRLPDFLRVVLYAGEAHSPLGAVLGQSLPNWGRVADQGRNRTMVMTNVRTDPDSEAEYAVKAARMLVPEALASLPRPDDPDLDTLLHEAAHNLGPSGDLVVNGRRVEDLLGGRLSSTMDELWAQTSALHLVGFLLDRGLVDEAEARRLWTGSVLWAFRHVATGMYTSTGIPKSYAQLAAVQVGTLSEAGALVWVETPDPTTGEPTGRFDIDWTKWRPAVEDLLGRTGRALATGDAAAAQALVDRYVSGEGRAAVHAEEIETRLRAFPDIHMVYAIDL